MHRHEFVALVAGIMAVNAAGVDLMLPALADIGRDLAIHEANHRQWIVTAYVLGFGAGQLIYGPLADRFGRKPVLMTGLAGFVVASIFAAAAGTFSAMLCARMLQGVMSASTRVLAVTIVRDVASGRRMARTMSVAQMIFFIVPIMAPSVGAFLLAFGPWRFVFYALGAFAASILAWACARLPETLVRTQRVPISLQTLKSNYALTLTERYSIGYTIASSLVFGGIIGFVSSSQQVFVEEFDVGRDFGLYFAICAGAMGFASFANSRLVERLGTRMISQAAIFGLIGLAIVHILVIAVGAESLATYVCIQALSMTCLGLCGSNFGAMAMEPVGHIAGTASSVQGFIISCGGVLVGSAIGLSYAGTTLPLATGYLCIGASLLVLVYFVEGRCLFRPHHI